MYFDFPDEPQAYNLSRMKFDNSYNTNPTNVSQEIQFAYGDDFVVSPVSRPRQKHSDQRPERRRLDDLRPFVLTNGTCCGPAKLSPHAVTNADTKVDPDGFTIFAQQWCTGGKKKSAIACNHDQQRISPCADNKTCEARCKASAKCKAFAWQAAYGKDPKCYLWPCFAMGLSALPKGEWPGAVCGNRSASKPPPGPPPPPPGPPAPGPSACPGLGTPIAQFPVTNLAECESACDFSSGIAAVGCSAFDFTPTAVDPHTNLTVQMCALYNGWPSYVNTSSAAAAGGRLCANRTGGLLPAPNPPPSGHPGLAVQDVWIPPGTWMHWDLGELFRGPRTIETLNALPDIPAYVRSGAVVPLSSNATVHELAPDPLRLVVVAAGGAGERISGAGEVYEDDGDSFEHKNGGYRLMRVNHTTSSGKITTLVVQAHAEGKGYAGERSQRTLQVEIRLGASTPALPKSVRANGVAVPAADVAALPACGVRDLL